MKLPVRQLNSELKPAIKAPEKPRGAADSNFSIFFVLWYTSPSSRTVHVSHTDTHKKHLTSTHKTFSRLLTSHFVTLNSPHVFLFCWEAFSLQLCLMHLFLLIYSASQSRTCWYFVKLPMSHCMLTPSHFPTLLVSLTHTQTHTHTQSSAIWTAVLCTLHVY